ncbi:MAG: septum site-determining protein MinC [Geminocystis sp.]|nr:septum site-determining protein MinC [Geminocystis sp.]HIK36684.1 septum site-determining protein MinC [Geminocystis sp. M7585_C2015_104]MCS7146762.1 septum site-determining protein MinC [Geminocystis sp.]MCX8077088.1 septum site-determining protein MinC [Geminocystis sp.]MDW8115588.1 septum site-determining protein MinC [Geminocystis sp.]
MMEQQNIQGNNEEKKGKVEPTIKEQINLTRKGKIVEVTLPATTEGGENETWQKIIDDFKYRLQKIEKSWQPGTKTQLQTQGRLLDRRQLNELKTILEQVGLELELVITKRRQTAVAAASSGYSVIQDIMEEPKETSQELSEPLYLKTTIRSGVEICHPGSVVVVGDLNPGATIVAGGDVLIWGVLRGIAHAGANGNRQAVIMALKMQPTQLRIAGLVARAPSSLPPHPVPEVAYISSEGIRICAAELFYRSYEYLPSSQYWVVGRERQATFPTTSHSP